LQAVEVLTPFLGQQEAVGVHMDDDFFPQVDGQFVQAVVGPCGGFIMTAAG
jgi:hypothetical protein